jgi:hypothetical protein
MCWVEESECNLGSSVGNGLNSCGELSLPATSTSTRIKKEKQIIQPVVRIYFFNTLSNLHCPVKSLLSVDAVTNKSTLIFHFFKCRLDERMLFFKKFINF